MQIPDLRCVIRTDSHKNKILSTDNPILSADGTSIIYFECMCHKTKNPKSYSVDWFYNNKLIWTSNYKNKSTFNFDVSSSLYYGLSDFIDDIITIYSIYL